MCVRLCQRVRVLCSRVKVRVCVCVNCVCLSGWVWLGECVCVMGWWCVVWKKTLLFNLCVCARVCVCVCALVVGEWIAGMCLRVIWCLVCEYYSVDQGKTLVCVVCTCMCQGELSRVWCVCVSVNEVCANFNTNPIHVENSFERHIFLRFFSAHDMEWIAWIE